MGQICEDLECSNWRTSRKSTSGTYCTNRVTYVAFSPDGKQVVSGSNDRTVRIWDAKRGAAIGKPLEGHNYAVRSVTFSPDGKQVMSGSDDNTVCIWDVVTAEQTVLEGHTEGVRSVAFSPNGDKVVSGSYDNTVCIWDVATGEHTVSQGPSTSLYSVNNTSDKVNTLVILVYS